MISKKFVFVISCIILITNYLTATNIQGKVMDENQQPIEFANVVLYSLPDSALVSGTITNKNGEFSLTANGTEKGFLKISFIGYETQTVPAISGQTITLKVESRLLNEVVVQKSLPKIQLKNDALVATVQNSVLSSAGTANDVLKRLPLLTGDDGVFSVFGKGEAKIYINNREMRDVSELDNLNSADIKDVEIVTNPGARYDASVKAVIRIYTVRKAGDGFGFDLRSGYNQSQNTDLTEQLNMNYRKDGWDVFGTLKYYKNSSLQDSKMWQETYVDTLWRQENTLYSSGTSHTLTGIAGANYEFSQKHYAGIKYTHNAFLSNKWASTMNSTVYADNIFYDKWSSEDTGAAHNKPAHRLNGYYNGSFGNLNIDFNADFYTNKQYSSSETTETSQEYDNRKVNSENNVENRLIAEKLILTYPLLGGQFSLGNEYTNTHRTDEYLTEQNIVPSSNTTIHEENNSFFAEYSRKISIANIGAGLRYENVNSEYFINDILSEEESRRYHQWFPNVSCGAQIKNVNLQLSYTKKTERPTYRQLSSNVYYGNRFTLQTGNPFLKPTVVHNLTLVSAWKFLQVMVSYTNEKDAIIYWTEQLETNPAVSVIAYKNLEELPSLTTFFIASPTFGIWIPQLSVGFIKQWLTITTNNEPIKLNKPLPIVSLNNSFRLPKEYLLTFDAHYQGKGNYQNVYLTENQYVLNVGITKSFLNNSLRVELKGNDLLYKRKDGNLLYNHQMNLLQINHYDTRQLELTVRYNFNTAKSKYKGTGAGEKEMKRL
ncbi:MAG: TonB-dependent receptor [Paludibacteraceae bacterium]|nr:TonB-dependent receptor [Paludibacteraceae bacterium]